MKTPILKLLLMVCVATMAGGFGASAHASLFGPVVGASQDDNGDEVEERGTFVQLTPLIAVTVKHIGKVRNMVCASDRYDVQFFGHPSSDTVTWVVPKGEQTVDMRGLAGGLHNTTDTDLSGTDIDQMASYTDNVASYRLVSLPGQEALISGMSGGPVSNGQKQVIGINVGHTIDPVSISGQAPAPFSYYLPYDIIQAEWARCQNQLGRHNL